MQSEKGEEYMKKIALILLLLVLITPARAAELHVEEIGQEYYAPVLMYTTAYVCGTHTADGTPVREGLCAMNRGWIGKTAIVYSAIQTETGEYMIGAPLGIFEIKDPGKGAVGAGKCIDIYRSDMERAREWMMMTSGKCYVQVIDSVG